MKTDAPGSPAAETLILDPLDTDLHVDAWQALSDACLDANPFFRPAFLRPFLDNMGGHNVRLVVVRESKSGRWLLAAPFGRRAAGLAIPVATAWASDYAPLGTPLMHPDAGNDDIRLFLRTASGRRGVLAFPFLPLASRTAERLTSLGTFAAFVPSRWERAGHSSGADGERQLEEAFKGKRRKEMRRLLRRLEDHGAVRFLSVGGSEAASSFEQFLQLEASGWKGQSKTALGSRHKTAAFSREAVAASARSGNVRIDELRAGETLVASLVSFVDGGHVFTWKIAFDEDFARYSPGAQLALHAFRQNLAQPGFKQADSLAIPGHSMIEPLWRGRLEIGTLLLAGSAFGRLTSRLCAADLAVERELRNAARTLKSRLKR